MKNKGKKLAIGASAIAAAAAAYAVLASRKKNAELPAKPEEIDSDDTDNSSRHAYFVGGGLASLSGAAYLLRDGGFKGENIHILEGLRILGGSNDGNGSAENGFVCRGGRMLNEETFENLWELFSTIPSLDNPDRSVTEEILNFDHAHPTCAKARLVDKEGRKLDVTGMGFSNQDRVLLAKLLASPEQKLDHITIEEWFMEDPQFFETNFWYMWQTTFAFQKWSSVFEFKRYMNRMIFEFSRIETLEGVTRTPYNQYESLILPLKAYLEKHHVDFSINSKVVDIDFKEGDGITAERLHLSRDGEESVITLLDGDICFMTNGCMTDSSTLGDYHTPPEVKNEKAMSGELWAKVAAKKEGLGNPEPFFGNMEESNWESFTVTCKGNKLLKMIENYSGNIPGSGALMTFKDSNWLMSIVVAAQPHFRSQPMDTTIFWGYGLYTDRVGDYVKKPMRECTGEELLYELIHHLHFEDHWDEMKETVVNVIPAFMPYIDAQFQPRAMSDRPPVVPEGSTNFAMASQFVEIADDMVFTEEYSVRAARTAVYTLLGIDREICPVTPHNKNPKVLFKALKKSLT